MATTPTAPIVVSGIRRHLGIPASTFTAEDLRRLYTVLEAKCREAGEHQVSTVQRMPEQTAEQFEQVKATIRSWFKLLVRVQGSNGEWTVSVTDEALQDRLLPDTIASVEYESASLYRNQFQEDPQNSFVLSLDFIRTELLDMSSQPEPNKSWGMVSGSNRTWVNGTFEELHKFLNERSNTRGWLHSKRSYDIAVLLFGLLLSFTFVYRIDRWVRPFLELPDALFVALYVYLVLIALTGFRLLFNYARWVFPKCEGPTRRQGGPKYHKTLLGVIGTGLLASVAVTLLKMLGFPVP